MSEEDPGLVELQIRFVRGLLDVTIMKLLLEEPLWGYKMMEVLNDRYGVKVGPAVIYPLLDSMEADGLILAEEVYSGKRKRKVYKVLPQGETMLKNMDRILKDF
jgi:DNA-binding PadR family transcriptional regulator